MTGARPVRRFRRAGTAAVGTLLVAGIGLYLVGERPAPPSAAAQAAPDTPRRMCEHTAKTKLDAQIARSRAFRITFALRSDVGHIKRVLADPRYRRSRDEFDVALTPVEVGELNFRVRRLDPAVELIRRYGARRAPGALAGTFLSTARSGKRRRAELGAGRAEVPA